MPGYPSTKPATGGPALPAGGESLEIRGPGRELFAGSSMIISGAFRVSGATRTALGPTPHHALVLVVSRKEPFAAVNPFAGVALFPDDVQPSGDGVAGHFQVDVGAAMDVRHAGRYYVVCALGKLLSNVLEIDVVIPPK